MAVPEQTPYIEHTGNGATTSFSLGFQCESKDHLIVLVDEVEPPIATWSLTGGNVVFTAAPTSGQKITLQRNTPFERTTDYQSYNNSFRPPAVNNDFDRVWWKIQELGVGDWLLGLKIQKFRDDVNLTALENTLIQAQELRDSTAVLADEVLGNTTQSQTLLVATTAQANAADLSATSANSSKDLAKQYADNIDASLTAIAGGHKAYQTLAAAQAAQATLPVNSVVEVTNDPTASNNGTYQWNGTTLTKSAYDPLTQAKADATTKANTAEANAKNYTDSKTPTKHIMKGVVFSIADAQGNSITTLEDDGTLKVPAIEDANGLISSELQPKENISPYAYSIADENGNPILKIKQNGTLVVESVEDKNGVVGSSGVPLDKIFNNVSQLDIFINHGQSNGSGGVPTTPPVTDTQEYNNWLLNDGSVSDLVIASDKPETPSYHAMNQLSYMTLRDTNLNLDELSSRNGVFSIAISGTGITTLYSPIHSSFITFKNWLIKIKAYCDINNITCNVKAMTFTHGEFDTDTMTVDEYLGHQYALYDAFNSEAKTITGQKNDMKFLTWSLGHGSVYKAQAKAHYQHPNMLICFPKYCSIFADGTHMSAVGTALAGAYYAKAYRYHFEQGKDWQPLMATTCRKFGDNAVKVTYSRKGLTFDNSRFSATGGGFYGTDSSGALTVSSYVVDSFSDVIITFNRDIVGDLTFGYGVQMTRNDIGNTKGGTLRDNDGLFETTEIAGTTYPLHNWALNFEEIVK